MSKSVAKQAITYRVRGSIPVDGTKEWLINVLRANFTADESDIIKKVKPIPSVTRSGERCGLLWLKRAPTFLADLEKDDTSEKVIDLDDDEGTLTFDRHFYGLTQLYDTTPGDPILADIVAISGLDGHAFGSWREKGNIGQMWLTDWLPKDLPHCRVMSYGYNCKIQANMRPIREYGEAIGEALRKARKNEDERNRPLIFMGHSFGGLLAAHTLVRAHTYDTPGHTDPLYSCIYGFIFFGTPHRGLKTDTFKQMMPKDVDPVLLDTIAKDSEFLESMHENFKAVLGERKVLSFYEGRGTKSLVKDEASQKWGRTGDREMMVNKVASTLGTPGEKTLPCDADHSFMVKLSDKDGPTYTSVISILTDWQGHAPEAVSALNSYVSNETQQEEMYAIMNSLSPFAFEEEPREIIMQKYPSAEQFLQSGSFSYWCDHDKPTLLECHGQPDSGKTVRAAFVAQHLFDLHGHKPVLEKAVFYLHLNKRPQGTLTIENLLGSLLRQLTYLRQSVSNKIGKLANGLRPTLRELRDVLIFETKRLSRVFIIIDGWDQCSDDIRLALRDEMTFLANNNIKLSQMRIRQSLEPKDGICCDMEDCRARYLGIYYHCDECDKDLCRKCKSNGRTCLDKTHKIECRTPEYEDIEFGTSKEEIYGYIMFMLEMDLVEETKVNTQDPRLVQKQNLSKLGSILRTDRELLESIPAEILDRAALSWKWARRSIESLRTRHSPEQVREDLELGFPDAIQHFYDDEMIEIFDQPKSDGDLARKVLSILTCIKVEAIGMEILRHAMAIKEIPNTFDLKPDMLITSDWILLVTKGLVITNVYGDEEKAEFNHESIRAYLEKNEKRWIPTAKIDVANTCLWYLSLTPFSHPSTSMKLLDQKIRQYPFVAYAAEYWGEHLKDALESNNHTDADLNAAMTYLENNSAAFVQLAWHASYRVHGWDVYKSVHGLHICAYYGLEKLVAKYLEKGVSLDVTEGTYNQTPLFYACRNGHAGTARLLIKAGANVNHVSKRGKTPLMEAVERDRLSTVKLLMDEAEDLDANKVSKKRLYRSAVMIAAGRKNYEIVEYLSRHKDRPVDLNMEDAKGLNALQIAIMGGGNDCEDISNRTQHDETPCDPEGQLKTVALLLKHRKKIDINHVESTKGRSALSIAAIYGEVDIVKSLLKKKADPNLADRDGVSPAMHAAKRRYLQVVKALLEKTDSDVADKQGRYLIHFAAMSGSCDILAFLCGRHANLNAQDAQGFTPLHYTARYNHVEATEFLLKRGASVKLKDKFNRTPMRLSWQYGQYAITELFQHINTDHEEPNLHIDKRPSWSLGYINTGKEFKPALENLKDKNHFDNAMEPGTGNTLLHIAAHHRDDEMKMLRQVLEHPLGGLDINKQNNDGHTPLHVAVQYGNIDGVRTLIEHGALCNISDKWGRTPFSLAYELASENGMTKQSMLTIMLILHSPEDLKTEDQNLLELFLHACQFKLYWAVERLMKEHVDEGTTFARWCKRIYQHDSHMVKILQSQDSYHTIKYADDSDSDESHSDSDSDDEDEDDRITNKKDTVNKGVSTNGTLSVADDTPNTNQEDEPTGAFKDVSSDDNLEGPDDEFNIEWDTWPMTLDLIGLVTTGPLWFASYGSIIAEAMILL